MKKFLLASTLFLLIFLVAPQAEAEKWRRGNEYYMAGDCYMVDSPDMASDHHVYTLNPDHTYQLNYSYALRWGRNARCDELQFHVDHNTSLSRLNTWLDEVAFGWYSNLSASHFNHQTLSTSRHEWFYVDENGIHRIPDWLTGLSWGLLIRDRLSVSFAHEEMFYQLANVNNPLNYNDGSYADEINSIWLDGETDYSNLPDSLADELEIVVRQSNAFNSCAFSWESPYPSNPWRNLFDWSWMQRNSGCSD